MTVEEFAKFWEHQGCRTFKGAGTFWYAVRPLVFISLPYERAIQPTRLDLLKLFGRTPALVLRYRARPSGTTGDGGVYVCGDKRYDLGSLIPRARSCTRKGLRECTVQRVEFSALVEIGHQLNQETFQRQGRQDTGFSRDRWQRYCQAAEKTAGMEAWGAFAKGRLAAFVVCALVGRCYNFIHQSSSRELLPHQPNNALAFAVTRQALNLPGVDEVCYGLKSVEHTEGLERFKLGMGFSIRPFEERLALHPLLQLALAFGGRLGVKWAAARKPDSDFWRKALIVCQMERWGASPAV
jgi:hypothetical protein